MKVLINRIYKHFKGDYYIVIDFAIDSNSLKKVVIYKSLYGNGDTYVREYDEFCSLVDKNKYPDCKQKYRFELQDIKSVK